MLGQTLRIATVATGGRARAIPRKLRLTNRLVEQLTCPPGKSQAAIYDTEQPRLLLLITRGGAKTWYAYAKENGRPIRWKLGATSVLNVDAARRACRAALAGVGGLTALVEGKSHAAAVGTMAELFTQWRAAGAGEKKSAAEDQANWDRYCASLASRAVVRVTTAEISALHRRVGARQMPGKAKGGKVAANRTLALLRAMLAWAVEQKLIGSNPADGVRMYDEQERERFLHPEEIPKFLKALDAEPNPTLRDLFRMLLATGARRGNVQAMRWEDVDLANKLWRLPAKSNKSGRFVVVPLLADAMEILTRRRRDLESEEWVFPSTSRTGHVVHFYAAWNKLVERAGLDDLRPHDIRRTVGATMAMNNASDRMIAAALGQTSTSATGVYARLRMAGVREALETAQDVISQQAKTNPRE